MDKEELLYFFNKRMEELIQYATLKLCASEALYIIQKLNRLIEDVPEYIYVFIGKSDDPKLILEWEIVWGKILRSLNIEDDILAGLEF